MPENHRLLAALLDGVDVLLALFAAQNPRLQDNPHSWRFRAAQAGRRRRADLNQLTVCQRNHQEVIAACLHADLEASWAAI